MRNGIDFLSTFYVQMRTFSSGKYEKRDKVFLTKVSLNSFTRNTCIRFRQSVVRLSVEIPDRNRRISARKLSFPAGKWTARRRRGSTNTPSRCWHLSTSPGVGVITLFFVVVVVTDDGGISESVLFLPYPIEEPFRWSTLG